MIKFLKLLFIFIAIVSMNFPAKSQISERIPESISMQHDDRKTQWFKDAKFGMFIHWGLYSELAGKWKGKNYYGSGEWIMNRARISVADYAKIATSFNPIYFNADQWVHIAHNAGIRYMVITAKHHEGFSMFKSKISKFNIADGTPFKKDPMQDLSKACRKAGIQFGFYYSQFLDWHEKDGGGNDWDFDERNKNYQRYYKDKAIPQLKELLTNYGPLGILWFDQPGGLSQQETKQMVDSLKALQPNTLFSSRVGQGLGDYMDFGDSETPPYPIKDSWEAIYTHNDSWGYIQNDMNFKSSKEIIQLLANVVSKGGNLMLNIGPDGSGHIPYYSVKFLKEVGSWLKKNGESIYGTTYGFIPAQPWGVTTGKYEKLFLHVFKQPFNNKLFIPDFPNDDITGVYSLTDKKPVKWNKTGNDLIVETSPGNPSPDNVFVVKYKGEMPSYDSSSPVIVSSQFSEINIDAVYSKLSGEALLNTLTYSHYFGDWKHATCIIGAKSVSDIATFQIRVTEPGDYKLSLEYACQPESAKQEGSITLNGKEFAFETLATGGYNENTPLMFIKHPVATTTIEKPGIYSITLHPMQDGKELFKLKRIIIEPL